MVWLSQLSRSFLRDRLISLATLASILANPCALAQDQARMRQVPAARTDGSEQEIIVENALAISKMSLGMSVDPTGDADRDFVALMMPHHQGAIDIARAELKYGHNEELRRLAQNIIAERERCGRRSDGNAARTSMGPADALLSNHGCYPPLMPILT